MRIYCEKGPVVASSYILYYSGLNAQFYDVNNKFCNKNLVRIGLVQG